MPSRTSVEDREGRPGAWRFLTGEVQSEVGRVMEVGRRGLGEV